MKRRILVPMLICCLLLCACGRVGAAEKAIDNLGKVTPDSGQAIEAVQAMLDEMSDEELDRIKNLGDFEDYREEYRQQCELLAVCREAIQAIGTVTLESNDRIEAARRAYGALEKDELTEYVSDVYPVLEAAEAEYKRLNSLLTTARSNVNSIDYVSVSNKFRITAARDAVDNAINAGLGEYLKDEIARLEAIEAELTQLDTEQLYNTTMESLRAGDYEKAKASIEEITTEYPNHAKGQTIKADAAALVLTLIQDNINNKAFLKAKNAFDGCDMHLAELFVERAAEYEALRMQLQEAIVKARPTSGTLIVGEHKNARGQFKVINHSNMDAEVQLVGVQLDGGAQTLLFYVRAGETATVSVADGMYKASYRLGETWYGPEGGFGEENDFQPFKDGLFADTVVFSTSYSGNTVNYTVYTATILG